MVNDYLVPDDVMVYNTDRNAVLIMIEHTHQPVELQDGILKLISYAPHGNLVNGNAMDDESSEFQWHVK